MNKMNFVYFIWKNAFIVLCFSLPAWHYIKKCYSSERNHGLIFRALACTVGDPESISCYLIDVKERKTKN